MPVRPNSEQQRLQGSIAVSLRPRQAPYLRPATKRPVFGVPADLWIANSLLQRGETTNGLASTFSTESYAHTTVTMGVLAWFGHHILPLSNAQQLLNNSRISCRARILGLFVFGCHLSIEWPVWPARRLALTPSMRSGQPWHMDMPAASASSRVSKYANTYIEIFPTHVYTCIYIIYIYIYTYVMYVWCVHRCRYGYPYRQGDSRRDRQIKYFGEPYIHAEFAYVCIYIYVPVCKLAAQTLHRRNSNQSHCGVAGFSDEVLEAPVQI